VQNRLWIAASCRAKDERGMYDPFVRACNYALHALSVINDVDGLPKFSKENQIVFFRNHDQAVRSGSHQRKSQVRPDVVLLQWNTFKSFPRERKISSYSESYNSDICVSGTDSLLFWSAVRSTVEMKFAGLTKYEERTKKFDGGFEDLKESSAGQPSPPDNPQPEIFKEALPEHKRE
jgi:hypothetical protein